MEPANFYHIFNRGNNRQRIFFTRENYIYFLNKVEKHLLPHLHMLAYCLMPNHFHFLIFSKENLNCGAFSKDLQIMLRSYTRAINKQEDRTGSLFQQNTKIKELLNENLEIDYRDDNYPLTCFHYIHQNPIKSGIVGRMEDWEMSSFQEYVEIRENQLVSIIMARNLLDIPDDPELFVTESYRVLMP
jgi:REP element-mobilizing transposase RayT